MSFFLLHIAMVETNFKWRPGDQPWSYCSPFHIQRSWIQQGRVTKFGSIARQEEETNQFHENIHVWSFSSPSNHDESYPKSHRYVVLVYYLYLTYIGLSTSMKVRCTMYVSKTLTSKFVFLSFWGVLLLTMWKEYFKNNFFYYISAFKKDWKQTYSAQCIALFKKRLIKEIAKFSFYS